MPSKILVVEDNEMNRDMLARWLQRQGYEIEVAADGRQGLELASKSLPDLILLDLSLPEIDGWEVSRRLKLQERTSHIPIIALTAHAMMGDREKALSAGCDEYATKPVEFERLQDKIQELLAPRSSM
jgi:CheY-like chemotaxis protein